MLVLPVQQTAGFTGNTDAELAFALTGRPAEVDWILPDDIDVALARSPAIQAKTRGLAVGQFFVTEVDRVGDPLYGELRRMGALFDASAALIPLRATYHADPGEQPTLRLTATIIELRTGRVAWFGMVEGGSFAADDPRALTSAAEALARTVLWYVAG